MRSQKGQWTLWLLSDTVKQRKNNGDVVQLLQTTNLLITEDKKKLNYTTIISCAAKHQWMFADMTELCAAALW